MIAPAQKSDFYYYLFDAVVDSRQIIDDASTTKDICIDDNLVSDEGTEDDSKEVIDNILKDINHSEILIQYKPKITTTTTTTIKNDPESFNFKDTSLTKKKRKNSRYLPRAELSIKSIKNLDKRKTLIESSNDSDIEFIKLVP